MSYVEIEVRAKTVDLAVEAAMQELGVDDREQLAVTVIKEPERGFLGMGGTDAIVQVKRRKPSKRRRDRGKKNTEESSQTEPRGRRGGGGRGGNAGKAQENRGKSQRNQGNRGRDMSRNKPDKKEDDREDLSIEKQTEIVEDFLKGLVDVYGLEGEVVTHIDDDVIVADIKGEQTEALIGVRGSVRSAIHELTRTVLQRYASDSARLRLDIAGYAERRREALTIYANQLIEQLTADGGELMLEPMSSADRKVIHDAAADSDTVDSYSEGEPPRRYVVLTAVSEKNSDQEEE
ncbi:MAG: RNA-binding cell elongation regulator Jag/EloR [Acidimicrobiia bacterium]